MTATMGGGLRAGRMGAALTLILVMVCASCGQSSSPSSDSAATMPTTAEHPPAQFVASPCPNTPKPVRLLERARCGVLVVPENRSKTDGRTLRLSVAVVPSETQPPAADPIVFLQGGPGVDGVQYPPVPADVGLNHSRDLVMMSQRGNYLAQPALMCQEIDQFEIRRVGMVFDAPSTGDAQAMAARTCHDRLAVDADLAAFNSIESAYDLRDLRTALGVEQWNISSVSYGNYLALIYMRLDPNGIRSVTLDGVTPPSAAGLGWTWSSVRETFDNMTNACVAQKECNARYPSLAQTFIGQVNQLEASPVTTTVNVPGVGDTAVVLDGGALLDWFATIATHSPEEFPAAIDELAQGNPRRVAEQVAASKADPANTVIVGQGFAFSVLCSEWVPFESVDDELRLAQQAFPEFPDSVQAQSPQLAFLRQECDAWNVPKALDSVRAVTKSDIPTLVLSGSYDAQTGPQWGRYVAQHLSQSTVVTMPGAPHGVYHHPCGAAIIASFIDNPGQPDTSCIDSVHVPVYAIEPA